MSDEELLAVLHEALAAHEKVAVAATVEVERCRRAIEALSDAPAEEVAVEPAEQEAKPPRVAEMPAGKRATPPPRKLPPRPKDHRCEHCGTMFSAQGIAVHRKGGCKAKPTFGSIDVRAGKPLPPLASVPDAHDEPPRPFTPQVDETHFECSSCRNTFPTTRELAHHTITAHDRPARPGERVAIPA